jgi:hypothetical protein
VEIPAVIIPNHAPATNYNSLIRKEFLRVVGNRRERDRSRASSLALLPQRVFVEDDQGAVIRRENNTLIEALRAHVLACKFERGLTRRKLLCLCPGRTAAAALWRNVGPRQRRGAELLHKRSRDAVRSIFDQLCISDRIGVHVSPRVVGEGEGAVLKIVERHLDFSADCPVAAMIDRPRHADAASRFDSADQLRHIDSVSSMRGNRLLIVSCEGPAIGSPGDTHIMQLDPSEDSLLGGAGDLLAVEPTLHGAG